MIVADLGCGRTEEDEEEEGMPELFLDSFHHYQYQSLQYVA